MRFFKYVFTAVLCCAGLGLISTPAQARQVQLSWEAPKNSPDFAKYWIYWGEKSGKYIYKQETTKKSTSITIKNLKSKKTYYFAATSVTAQGLESKYSNEVSVYLDVDTDGDGILDQDEIKVYGTNPNLADTDGDGLNDGKELAFWNKAWNQDFDGDGISNLLDPDSDNDGVNDAKEISDKTDPKNPKSFLEKKPEPKPLPIPPVVPPGKLPVLDVTASDAQNQNVPANTIDGNMKTRWTAHGDGQSITYDIGASAAVDEVAIVWGRGDQRRASFDIETSLDGENWNKVFSGKSSGKTADFEFYSVSADDARYLRIVGYGNSSNNWNNIIEVELYGQLSTIPLPIVSVQASDAQAPNVAENTLDGDTKTRWSAQGDGQWISFDAGVPSTVNKVSITWFKGQRRKAYFSIEVSTDGKAWKEVFSGESSGRDSDMEPYTFPAASARFVRITGFGNSSNRWNSIVEVEISGQLDMTELPVASVTASDAQKPNVAENTLDGDMKTRWSAQGDGQSITYDIGVRATINEVAIAWLKGDRRKAAFAIEVSTNGKTWKEVFSGESSGKTIELESYTFNSVSTRYVRITGFGNSSNRWNSIVETVIYGLID